MKVDQNTSDGFHTFHELYQHRHALFIALLRSHPDISWKSKLHHDGTMHKGWIVAGMNLPSGQITYHLPAYMWRRDLKGVKALLRAPEWDGYTPNDVIKRLKKFHP